MKVLTGEDKVQIFIDGRFVRLSPPQVVIVIDDWDDGSSHQKVVLLVEKDTRAITELKRFVSVGVDVFVYTPEGLLKTHYTGRVPVKTGDTYELCPCHLFDFDEHFQKTEHFGDHYFIELDD